MHLICYGESMSTKAGSVHLNVPLPPEVHDKLAREAERNERSLRGEIVYRLRLSVEQDAKEQAVKA